MNVGGSNPCTPENIAKGKTYFSVPNDDTHFIECGAGGDANILPCPDLLVWDETRLSCVYKFEVGRPKPTSSTGQLSGQSMNLSSFLLDCPSFCPRVCTSFYVNTFLPIYIKFLKFRWWYIYHIWVIIIQKQTSTKMYVHHFKSGLINNMDNMRISGTGPSWVIIGQWKYLHVV